MINKRNLYQLSFLTIFDRTKYDDDDDDDDDDDYYFYYKGARINMKADQERFVGPLRAYENRPQLSQVHGRQTKLTMNISTV